VVAEGLCIISEYVEAETGKGADALERRPQLTAASAAARAAKCIVLVSKLDRLSRAAEHDRSSVRNFSRERDRRRDIAQVYLWRLCFGAGSLVPHADLGD
jgi:DNA invertase Pin-like site-specific DNA recombinase